MARDTDTETLRDRLRRLIEETGGMTAAASRVGCTTAALYQILDGGRPGLPIAVGIEQAYGIPPRAWLDEPVKVSA